MRFEPLTLEPRTAPAAFDRGAGVVHVRTGWEVPAFEDWHGGLNVFDAGRTVLVAPTAGGGPRVREFDVKTGAVLKDYFAGDPESRSGVVFVGAGTPVVPEPARPHVAAGVEGGLFVFVDEEREVSIEDTAATVNALPGLFPGIPLRFGTDRPDAPAGSYATVVLGAPLDWFAPGTLGLAVGSVSAILPTQGGPQAVYVANQTLTPAFTAIVAAHELGHLFGLPHRNLTIMAGGGEPLYPFFAPDQLTTIEANVAAALAS